MHLAYLCKRAVSRPVDRRTYTLCIYCVQSQLAYLKLETVLFVMQRHLFRSPIDTSSAVQMLLLMGAPWGISAVTP